MTCVSFLHPFFSLSPSLSLSLSSSSSSSSSFFHNIHRYYEGKDDFDVAKSISSVKISIKGRKLKVSIDPRATGEFKSCFESANVLPADFDISKGFFGLTATTGGLADNHDVLAMNAYQLDAADQEGPDPDLHYTKKPDVALPSHETVGDPNYDPEAALRSLISTEKKITKQQVGDVKHYVEHQMYVTVDISLFF